MYFNTIDFMREEIGIPVFKIKLALGLELELRGSSIFHATTIEEVEHALILSRGNNDSEAEACALIKMNELLLTKIKKENSLEELKNLYKLTPSNSESQKAAICKIAKILED